ncbi:hypothetical protein RAH42_13110 (plasmid) [Pyramidobacter sp. YE332]|uniref:hypothetical protein n=1 Tax=Pyramidobacter sp. YE332 TaxID=3068894 RepID=UPI00294B1672|nr:hypothetical protein [Pyramidobacter sp. YE332]WOL41351.1 hypothetical protein RAH42_13110 [Pyramidobacter sp. YE332]
MGKELTFSLAMAGAGCRKDSATNPGLGPAARTSTERQAHRGDHGRIRGYAKDKRSELKDAGAFIGGFLRAAAARTSSTGS